MIYGFTGFFLAMIYGPMTNAVSVIGWGNLILVWFGLAVLGVFVALPYDKILKR